MFPDAKSTCIVTLLAEDMLRRCKGAGIDCIIYGRVAPRMARIIIVVTESATSSSFTQFMLDIYLKARLDRIVFDEIHQLVTDTKQAYSSGTVCLSDSHIPTVVDRPVQ